MAIGNTLLTAECAGADAWPRDVGLLTHPDGMMPLGSMILGTIGEAVGTPLTVGVAAVVVVIFGLLSFRLFDAVRQMP